MHTVEEIAREHDIPCIDMDDEHISQITGGGLAAKYQGEGFIFVDPNLPPHTKDFTTAHELGHLLLGHLEGDMTRTQMKKAEQQAELFAVLYTALKAVLS